MVSDTSAERSRAAQERVLILVLMEDGLWLEELPQTGQDFDLS